VITVVERGGCTVSAMATTPARVTLWVLGTSLAGAIAYGAAAFAVPQEGRVKLTPAAEPPVECKRLARFNGTPSDIVEVECPGAPKQLFIVGENWFAVPGADAMIYPSFVGNGERSTWLLGLGGRFYFTDDGARSLYELHPPGWEKGATYQTRALNRVPDEISLAPEHDGDPTVWQRVKSMRVAWTSAAGSGWKERVKQTLAARDGHPPDSYLLLVSHDRGQRWSVDFARIPHLRMSDFAQNNTY